MKSLCQVLLLSATAAHASRHDPSGSLSNDGVLSTIGCGTVNFLVNAFLPQPHATAFCSAYLRVPEQSAATTNPEIGSTATIATTISQLVPTPTKIETITVLSTSTVTRDLWTGTPACSTVPKFDWVRERQRENPSTFLNSACRCLKMPESQPPPGVSTAAATVATVTEGLRGLAEVTVMETHTAVVTHTKLTFLGEVQRNIQNGTILFEDVGLPKVERGVRMPSNRVKSSWRSLGGSRSPLELLRLQVQKIK